jgi:putative acetyltransferase
MVAIRACGKNEKDVRALLEVHFASVHGEPSTYYEEQILEAWSPGVDEARVESFLQQALGDDFICCVATLDDNVVGFGAVKVSQTELCALYVHPRVSGQGVGSALLEELEKQAMERELDWLRVEVSLNAEGFYQSRGYSSDGLGRHLLPTGHEMSCVRMYKFLPRQRNWRP